MYSTAAACMHRAMKCCITKSNERPSMRAREKRDLTTVDISQHFENVPVSFTKSSPHSVSSALVQFALFTASPAQPRVLTLQPHTAQKTNGERRKKKRISSKRKKHDRQFFFSVRFISLFSCSRCGGIRC